MQQFYISMTVFESINAITTAVIWSNLFTKTAHVCIACFLSCGPNSSRVQQLDLLVALCSWSSNHVFRMVCTLNICFRLDWEA